jgi:hypothetical protein
MGAREEVELDELTLRRPETYRWVGMGSAPPPTPWMGWDLRLLQPEADLAEKRSFHRLYRATSA